MRSEANFRLRECQPLPRFCRSAASSSAAQASKATGGVSPPQGRSILARVRQGAGQDPDGCAVSHARTSGFTPSCPWRPFRVHGRTPDRRRLGARPVRRDRRGARGRRGRGNTEEAHGASHNVGWVSFLARQLVCPPDSGNSGGQTRGERGVVKRAAPPPVRRCSRGFLSRCYAFSTRAPPLGFAANIMSRVGGLPRRGS